jgi:predicted Fe-Mo cluster-binding NifX family protein
MKISIPVMENAFMASEVSGHFGKSPLHLVVESATGEIEAVIRRGEGGAGECAPVEAMRARGAEVVICQGLGQGALARLEAAGIMVYRTDCETVEAALEAFGRGDLEPMQLEQTCAGHGDHDHDHGHGGCDHEHD